jgi:GMP synthase (glutamine-hydrolysing)
MQHDSIAVVDFGGQYVHLIATKIRRLTVRADILDPMADIDTFRQYKGIILSGSPALSTYGEMNEYTREIFDLPIPILGFCFGHQEIAKQYGGKVDHTAREFGFANLKITGTSPIFDGLSEEEIVWMSHGDSVTGLPDSFIELGRSVHADPTGAATESGNTMDAAESHANAAIASESLKRYGFQFHPEVDDTVNGQRMLENFAVKICGCSRSWTIDNFAEEEKQKLREQVGTQKVFLLASGGVDSTVCARILIDALGNENVHLLHIDNGLMRKDESRQVVERFRSWGVTDNLHFVDASERFLTALEGIVEPEKKRIVIGNTFMYVCQDEMARLGVEDALLAQGTIYPDTIETGGTSRADVIKTHHNRVPLVEEMIKAGKVIEPIRELYKVEVRELGAALGIERDFLDRHPFPGPGLGVRLLCSRGKAAADGKEDRAHYQTGDGGGVDATLLRISEEASCIARMQGLDARALPIRSVGVKGDLRSYEWPVFLYEPSGGDAPWNKVLDVANQIYKEVSGVNRCVFDLSRCGWRRPAGAVPAAGEKESGPLFVLREGYTTRDRLEILRDADAIFMDLIDRYGLMNTIWQAPTVLLPMTVSDRGRELVVLRPVLSERAMTARPADLPEAMIKDLASMIPVIDSVSGVCIDVTTKPPGTIEWE